MMEGLRTVLPTAENHLLDLWQDLENRLRPLLRPLSHILSLSNNCKCSYMNSHFGAELSTQGHIIPTKGVGRTKKNKIPPEPPAQYTLKTALYY